MWEGPNSSYMQCTRNEIYFHSSHNCKKVICVINNNDYETMMMYRRVSNEF